MWHCDSFLAGEIFLHELPQMGAEFIGKMLGLKQNKDGVLPCDGTKDLRAIAVIRLAHSGSHRGMCLDDNDITGTIH